MQKKLYYQAQIRGVEKTIFDIYAELKDSASLDGQLAPQFEILARIYAMQASENCESDGIDEEYEYVDRYLRNFTKVLARWNFLNKMSFVTGMLSAVGFSAATVNDQGIMAQYQSMDGMFRTIMDASNKLHMGMIGSQTMGRQNDMYRGNPHYDPNAMMGNFLEKMKLPDGLRQRVGFAARHTIDTQTRLIETKQQEQLQMLQQHAVKKPARVVMQDDERKSVLESSVNSASRTQLRVRPLPADTEVFRVDDGDEHIELDAVEVVSNSATDAVADAVGEAVAVAL